MKNLGDFTPSKTIRCYFNTRGLTAAPITLASGTAAVYKDGGTTESTTGVTLSTDFDSRTGMHVVAVDTSADGTFYSAGSDFNIVLTSGTVDSISVVGQVVGMFSLSNRSALRPATADRTISVDASGFVTVATNNDKTGYSVAAGGLAAVTAWTVAITGNITGSLSGSVGSVSGTVGSVTGNVGGSVASVTGLNAALLDVAVSTRLASGSYSAAPSAADIWTYATRILTAGTNIVLDKGTGVTGFNDITAAAAATAVWASGTRTLTAFGFSVTVGTNSDKTGYSLSQAFPSNFSSLAIDGSGRVTSTASGGGATVEEITAALLPTITAGSFTSADRSTLGQALTVGQFVALQNP